MEKKYAVMRVTQNGKDRVITQEVLIPEDAPLKMARDRITKRVKQQYPSVLWIAWVDELTQLTPIQID